MAEPKGTPCPNCPKDKTLYSLTEYAQHIIKVHPDDTVGVSWAQTKLGLDIVVGKDEVDEPEELKQLRKSRIEINRPPKRREIVLSKSDKTFLNEINFTIQEETTSTSLALFLAKSIIKNDGLLSSEDFFDALKSLSVFKKKKFQLTKSKGLKELLSKAVIISLVVSTTDLQGENEKDT